MSRTRNNIILWTIIIVLAIVILLITLSHCHTSRTVPRNSPVGVTTRKRDNSADSNPSKDAKTTHKKAKTTRSKNKPDDSKWSETSRAVSTDFSYDETTVGLKYPEEPQHSMPLDIVYYKAYSAGFDAQKQQSRWVSYEITAKELSKNSNRHGNFKKDPSILGMKVSNSDYRKSGYDKGHLAPSADMQFDKDVNKESFYFTNISPQTPSFNRGIWKSLEEQVRNWAEMHGNLYVTTGPAFIDPVEDYVGNERIPVPSHFYKVLLARKNGKWYGIGFLIPHYGYSRTFRDYIVPINAVEESTQLNFFPMLNDSIEDEVESNVDTSFWFYY